MEGYDATPVELQLCGSLLGQIERDASVRLRALVGEVDRLVTGGWQGAAAAGFAEEFRRWRSGAGEALDALAVMGRLLGDTGRDYGSADDTSADMVWQAGEEL